MFAVGDRQKGAGGVAIGKAYNTSDNLLKEEGEKNHIDSHMQRRTKVHPELVAIS